MSKKHFIALADHIIHSIANSKRLGIPPLYDEHTLESLADFCQQENSQFKRDRWLDYIAGACGPNGGTIKREAVTA